MATQIVCDFKENDKAHPCGVPAVWRIMAEVGEQGGNTIYQLLGNDSCNPHVVALVAAKMIEVTKPDLGTRAVAEIGNEPSALGRTVTKVDPTKVRLRGVSIRPY